MDDQPESPLDPERIHPEGAPGAIDQMMRSIMGDTNFEQTREATLKAAKMQAGMQSAKFLAILLGTLVAFLFSVTLYIKWIF